jgi:DNA modification methylase
MPRKTTVNLPGHEDMRDSLENFKAEPRLQVHSFHRYFGKLIPAIPAFAIENFSKPGDTVLDPFCGSGTTIVEAARRGRRSVGIDMNPLATFITEVKTNRIPGPTLREDLSWLMNAWETTELETSSFSDPYVVNINHWFRPEVKEELLRLRHLIREIPDSDRRNFFLGVFSAFLRGVSNADPQHVFPGYSKRMRALDEAGREINVQASFFRAAKKRIQQIDELGPIAHRPQIFTGTAALAPLKARSIDLVVTNPPYISSIRYLETMKIEMGFLDLLTSQSEYLSLDRLMVGTERFYKNELSDIPRTGLTKIDIQAKELFDTNPKMAKTVAEYFCRMKETIASLERALKPGGHAVIKIMDSKVRNQIIPTPKYLSMISKEYGFTEVADIVDEFAPSSRSLLTARNTYSGLMTYDHILVLRKKR